MIAPPLAPPTAGPINNIVPFRPPAPPPPGPYVPSPLPLLGPLLGPVLGTLLIVGLDLLFPRPAGPQTEWTPPPPAPPKPGPNPTGQKWDLKFEEKLDSRQGVGKNPDGSIYYWPPGSGIQGDPERFTEGEWVTKYIQGATNWSHRAYGWTEIKHSDVHENVEPVGDMGITAITESWPSGISSTGQGVKNAAYGTPFGPFKKLEWYSEIRNFQKRKAGTGDEYEPHVDPAPAFPSPGPLVKPGPLPLLPPEPDPLPKVKPLAPPVPKEEPKPVPGPKPLTDPPGEAPPQRRPPAAPPAWNPGPGRNRPPEERPTTPPSPPAPLPQRPGPLPPIPERTPRRQLPPEQAPARPPVPAPTPVTTVITDLGPITARLDDIQPTLNGIRGKMARMNAEIEQLIREAAKPKEGPGIDLEALQQLLEELLKKPIPGGEWKLHWYCEKNPDGTPLDPLKFEIPAAPDQFTAILDRLRALQEMIDQSHKRRAFTCKGKPVGEPVTITFEEF